MSEEADKDKKDDKYATFDSQFRCITLNTLVELIDTYQNTIFKKQEEDLNLIKIKKDKSIVNAAEMEEKIKKLPKDGREESSDSPTSLKISLTFLS